LKKNNGDDSSISAYTFNGSIFGIDNGISSLLATCFPHPCKNSHEKDKKNTSY